MRVERREDVLLDAAFGEDGAGVALTTGTAFPIASISKSFDAACVVLLADRGLLSLDDSVPSRVDGAPPEWDAAGRRFSYSSLGFVLLAHIVESVAGMPYASFPAGEVLEPLGLTRTRAAEPRAGVPAARGSAGGAPVEPFALASICVGTGDVWSTTGDLVRLGERLVFHSGRQPGLCLGPRVGARKRLPPRRAGGRPGRLLAVGAVRPGRAAR